MSTLHFLHSHLMSLRWLNHHWLREEYMCFSNASTFRRISGVPLVIPEINPHAMTSYDGHACATNCTIVPVVTPMKGLRELDIRAVKIHTRQALSGAGWKLLFDEEARSGNVNPFIPGEEEKLIAELKHLLEIDIPILASCVTESQRLMAIWFL